MFPHDAVPDGSALLPHHLTMGTLLALLAVMLVWDDARGAEPWAASLALLAATWAFVTVWPHFPVVGATATLLGVSAAIVAVVVSPFWQAYPWIGPRGATLLAALIALDDAVEHAFGVPTPLDALWRIVIHPALPTT